VRGNKDMGLVFNIVVILALCLSGTMVSGRPAPDLGTLRTDQVVGLAEQENVAAQAELRSRAERGDSLAELLIASYYSFGVHGVPLDNAKAVFWYLKAANHTDNQSIQEIAAQNLGWSFENGKGVQQDDAQALLWYGKSGPRGAGHLQQLLANHPELNSVGPRENSTQGSSGSAVTAQQQETAARIKERQEEIADKIQELQSDIEEHESAAENWNDTIQSLANTSMCTGVGAALCRGIGQAGVAKAQAERNKELNASRADRAEISRLQGETAEISQRLDESLAGNFQQVVSQGGSVSNTDGNPQSLAIQRQLGAKPNMDQETRHDSPQKGCWNGKNGAASGIIPGSQTWSACPAY
jgi:hypothetical protein